MSYKILTYDEIDREDWKRLVRESGTGTWFQGPEAYEFFATQKDIMEPFVIGLEAYPKPIPERRGVLCAVCVGYVTREKNPVRQYFTRRAIILGGPAIADDCSDEEVTALMLAVRQRLQILNFRFKILNSPIYIETRNFNDYSRWKEAFEKAGFDYQPHLNIQIKISDEAEVMGRMGKHRRHRIQQSLRNGATIVEQPTIAQIEEWYALLADLYQTRIRKPLPSLRFFEALYECPNCRYTLVKDKEHIIGGAVAMCLESKAMYEWYACGRDEEKGNISPASLTKYGEMKYAKAKGLPTLDLMGAGEPGVPYGVRDFKSEFGGEMVEPGRFLCVCRPWFYKFGALVVKLLKR